MRNEVVIDVKMRGLDEALAKAKELRDVLRECRAIFGQPDATPAHDEQDEGVPVSKVEIY